MAKKLTPEQLRWLLDNYQSESIESIAAHLGCHETTARRRLYDLGLLTSEDTKIIASTSVRSQFETWERPCLRCRSTAPRPKWQYVCDSCKRRGEGLPDYLLLE